MAGAMMIVVGGAGAQEKTVCDSPCKLILLPLITERATATSVSGQGKQPFIVGKIDSTVVLVPRGRDTTYFEFQVEKPVRQVPNGVAAQYPDSLKAAKADGEVLAAFVVDTTGAADLSTLKILRSTHPMFTAAVRNALPRMQYTPAELHGQKVRQLVQQPFVFTISR